MSLRRALGLLQERDESDYCHLWVCKHCGSKWFYNSDSTSPMHCPDCHKSDFEYIREVDR